MHDYLFRPEVVRTTLVVGVVVSILFYERVQLTTGGAIVPAYLALFVPAPEHIVTTLLAGYLTYVVVSVLLTKRYILYGRRKFELEIVVGICFVGVGTLAAYLLAGFDARVLGLAGVGFLVPGLLAHDMFRQKPKRTLLAVTVTTGVIGAFVFVFSSLLTIAPVETTMHDDRVAAAGYPPKLLLFGVVSAIIIGILVFSQLRLRSGGLISGAYLALVLVRPLDLLFVAVVATVTWLVVTRLLMPNLLLFGRRKLSTMVLVGALVAWTAELAVSRATGGGYLPWAGLTVMTLMVPALLANDAQRQGIERTLWGAGLTSVGVFGLMNLGAAGASAAGWL